MELTRAAVLQGIIYYFLSASQRMEEGVRFIKFRDHTKLRGITSILEATIIIQKPLKRTERLSEIDSALMNVYNNTAVIQECSFAQSQDRNSKV